MASNENPLGTSPKALEAMRAELFKSNRYPESGCTELVAKLAAKHNVPKDWILVGNGLDDVITMIGMTILWQCLIGWRITRMMVLARE